MKPATPTPATTTPKLWDTKSLCEYLGIGDEALRQWIATGKFPKPMKLGRLNRWRPSVVDEWLRVRERVAGQPAVRVHEAV